MAALADLDLPAFDYTDADATGEAFNDAMRELRERTWIARAEPAGYLVLDHEAVAHFMRAKSATFPGRRVLEIQGVTSGALYERQKGTLLFQEGETHKRLRKLVQPAFSPKEADRWRPKVKELIEALWEEMEESKGCDFVASFAKPLPAQVIATIMGSPIEDAERLGDWANAIQGQFDPVKVANEMDRLNQAAEEFQEYVRDLLEKRRDEGLGDDLISTLLQAEEEGDQLSDEECIDMVSAVLVGGADTTQAQLAHGIRLFAEHPDQWKMLADDPELVPQAVEEVLRFQPITPLTARIVLEDMEYRDVSFPEGTVILACGHTANHDPETYEEPDTFDITAERGRAKPLTFGAGPHYCLGANLARAELQEAFAFLAPRMPGLELDGEPDYDTPLGVYAIRKLPISWS